MGQLRHCPQNILSFFEANKTKKGEGEVLNMSQINCIRDKRKAGYSVVRIAAELEIDEKTVRKYLKQRDFSPKPPASKEKPSILDPYKAQIRAWLKEDEHSWYKQRHTAKRIHERLQEAYAGYQCSYVTVQRFVKRIRAEQAATRACQQLVWHPGEAQADFGEVECICEQRVRKNYLGLSFPHSNNGLAQLFDAEASECVCQGLQDMFEEIGGVPPLILFDNAAGVGKRVGRAIQEAVLFQQFRAHYGFSVRFCNTNAGHEKGHIENKVGFIRRNWFVPVPQFDNIIAYNRKLLTRHYQKAEEVHYKKGKAIKDLFADDVEALLPLPPTRFDVCRYEYRKANGYGNVQVAGNHHYSTRPEYAGKEVLVGIRAHTIDIYEEDASILVSHRRQFGKERTDSIDYRTSLAVLMKNVGGWPNSGLREVVSESIREYFDRQQRDELKQALRTLHSISQEYDLSLALHAMDLAIQNRGEAPVVDAAVFAARLAEAGIVHIDEAGVDLTAYDCFFSHQQYHQEG